MDSKIEINGRFFEDPFNLEEEANKVMASLSDKGLPYRLRYFSKGELPFEDAKRIGEISITAFDFDDGTNPEELVDYYQDGVDYVATVSDSNNVVGYAAGYVIGESPDRLHHFGGAAVDREHQGKGLYSLLQKARLTVEPADIVQTRTGNPKVVSALRRLAKLSGHEFYPDGEEIPEYIKETMDWWYEKKLPIKNGLVDTSSLVWPNCYPDGTDAQLVYLVKWD